MQMSFHFFRPARMCVFALTTIFASWAFAATADPFASTWASGSRSKVRLIAAPWGPDDHTPRAGVELVLAPGTLTYWRMPGSAGVPPAFAFAGSENLREADILFPVPGRIDEEGTDVFGYLGEVIFPLRVTPVDATHPINLNLTLSYAVCERVCVPAEAEVSLTLPPRSKSIADPGPYAEALTRAEAQIPRHLTPTERDAKVTILPEAGIPGTWRLSLREGTAEDVFAEAPDGWYLETKKLAGTPDFLIAATETPKAIEPRVPVTLTLSDGQQGYEFDTDLDTASMQGARAASSN
jgi:DsbC/DsbD-like thiol-disulfide interchange protein